MRFLLRRHRALSHAGHAGDGNIGRTFIQPDDRRRRAGVHLKYNPLG